MTLLRAPVLHYAVLGSAVFAGSMLLDRSAASAPDRIIVSAAQVEQLAALFARAHRRRPSPEEQEALLRDHIETEVSYREALALGLDRDDAVIRQRLRHKLEFLFADVGARADPSDAQLQDYLQQHPDAFRIEPTITFEQVHLDPLRRSATRTGEAAGLLAELNQGRIDAATAGDSVLLEPRFEALTVNAIAQHFGDGFARALNRLPVGGWQGPIDSGYGQHLVIIRSRTTARLPPLDEVRDAVRAEWMNVERQKAKERFYAGLLDRYSVSVEPDPTDSSGTGSAAWRATPCR